MVANSNMTVEQMRQYIRKNNLNKPHLRLGMKRADLIAGLKKEGHWKEGGVLKKSKVKKQPSSSKNKSVTKAEFEKARKALAKTMS